MMKKLILPILFALLVGESALAENQKNTTIKVSFEYDRVIDGYKVSGCFYPCSEDGEWGKVTMNFIKDGKVEFVFHSDYYSCYSTTHGNIHWKNGEHYVFKYILPEKDNSYYSSNNPLGYHTSFQFYDVNFDGKPELLVSDYSRERGGNNFNVYSINGSSLTHLNYPPYNAICNSCEFYLEHQEIVTFYEDGVWEYMKIVFHKGKPTKVSAKDKAQFSSDSWIEKQALDAFDNTRDFYVQSIEYKMGDHTIKWLNRQ